MPCRVAAYGLISTLGGTTAGFFVTAGCLRGGNSSIGVVSSRRTEIVWPPAARVWATGTMYEIAREKTPKNASERATLRRRRASRLKRSAANELAVAPPAVMLGSPRTGGPPQRPQPHRRVSRGIRPSNRPNGLSFCNHGSQVRRIGKRKLPGLDSNQQPFG